MAYKHLFYVTKSGKNYAVEFDDSTLQIRVYDPELNKPVTLSGATNPKLDQTLAATDVNGQNIHFKGVGAHPYAAYHAYQNVGTKCYGFDLHNVDTDGMGRELKGSLVQANSAECSYVPPISFDIATQMATCHGSSSGSITVNTSGGTAPYSYLWNDGVTTKDRPAIPAGVYSFVVTDAEGFSKSSSDILITENTEIKAKGTVGDAAIKLEVTGGSAPYAYSWSNGATTKDITGVSEGVYQVTVTDSAGCSKTFTFSVVSERFYFSKNPVTLNLTALDGANKPNLTFLCEVWLERDYDSGSFERVAELEHPADDSYSTSFDVSAFLDAYLKPHFPNHGETSLRRADTAFKRFYLKHTEKFGTPAVPGDFTVQENRYVVHGGLNFDEQAQGTFFSQHLPTQKPFFSWLPAVKKVREDQPEYLYYMPMNLTETTFHVNVKVYYEDNTFTLLKPFLQTGLHRFELYAIPAGHHLLSLGTGGKQVTAYEIWVTDQDNSITSETRRFELDRGGYMAARYFLYANSMGGVNTLLATGRAALNLAIKQDTVEHTLPADYNPALGEVETSAVSAEPVLKLSTGYVHDQEEFFALQDFALSTEVRLWDNDRYIAGLKEVKNMEALDETTQLKVMDFEFRLPTMRHFTPKLLK
jgi:hypothetical protein